MKVSLPLYILKEKKKKLEGKKVRSFIGEG